MSQWAEVRHLHLVESDPAETAQSAAKWNRIVFRCIGVALARRDAALKTGGP